MRGGHQSQLSAVIQPTQRDHVRESRPNNNKANVSALSDFGCFDAWVYCKSLAHDYHDELPSDCADNTDSDRPFKKRPCFVSWCRNLNHRFHESVWCNQRRNEEGTMRSHWERSWEIEWLLRRSSESEQKNSGRNLFVSKHRLTSTCCDAAALTI